MCSSQPKPAPSPPTSPTAAAPPPAFKAAAAPAAPPPPTSAEQYALVERSARAFLAAEGPKLQWYLQLKAWFSANYVTDWWEKYVYLRGRSPLMIDSNYYICDHGWHCPTRVQAARAARVVWMFMRFKKRLDTESLAPMTAGIAPLCMAQYRRMFNTCRVPGRECDELRHLSVANKQHPALERLARHDVLILCAPNTVGS